MDVTRASEWGNTYLIGPGRSRAQAIALFRAKLEADPERVRRVQRELRGRDLVCCCLPKQCHAEVLLDVANRDELI